MKKRITALVLAFSLILTSSALAVADSTDNFIRSKSYSGQFSDLAAGSVFYDNVTALYEYGLSIGKTDGTFGAGDPVTVGQAVIFAARIRSLYASGDAEAGASAFRWEGQAAYESYLLYLQSLGSLGNELDGLYASAAPRKVVAHILANTLPEVALPDINSSLVTQCYATGKFISDVSEYTDYFRDILFLYQRGISQGSDDFGSFLPDASITRGALAAMLTRMIDPSLRITLTWDLAAAYSAKGTTWGDLVPDAAYIAAPSSQAEIETDVRYMLSQEKNVLSLRFSKITLVTARQIMEQALAAAKTYCEQCYNAVSCTFDPGAGDLTLTFSAAACAEDQLTEYRAYTLSAAIAVHDQLWTDGSITSDMSDYDKARVYYDWICRNCVYDYGAEDQSLSHIPYALFKNGAAVCDGYTGAYNLLLKLEGISCTALSNDSHIWTVAELDGTQYHIDTTWGDSNGTYTDYTYFAMTASQSWGYHSW